MERKTCERDFAKLMNGLGVWTHKWRDLMYCLNCHKPIFMTKRMEDSPEGVTSIVDYLCFVGATPMWVECKQDNESFAFSDITLEQRRFLDSWEERGVDTWLFLEMGPGRAPKERNAYFVRWTAWKHLEDQWKENFDTLSIPWAPNQQTKSNIMNAQLQLLFWKIDWVEGTWKIPEKHSFWGFYPQAALLPPLRKSEG